MQAMFSQISSPVPFKLGDSNSPLSHVPGGFISASPMIRRMNRPRTANTPPHVNPLPRRNGVLGHLHVPSLTGSNVLPSLTMMDRLLKEGHDKVKEWQQWYIDSNPRSQFLKSVMGVGVLSDPEADPVKKLYEALEQQVQTKGMFAPVFNVHAGGLVREYDSWKRFYPPQSALRTGGVVDIPYEFAHMSMDDKQLVCNLIAVKDETAYQHAEAVGNEAWKQGLTFAAQAVEHALFIAEGDKGVFKHVLNEHQTILTKMSDESADVDKIIHAMIKSTPDLNMQFKRNEELKRINDMISDIAQGVSNKNDMTREAEICDRNIAEMTYMFKYTMTDEQQKAISKEQEKRTMFLKESNRYTTNIVQAVTGTQLQPRSDQIKMDYRIYMTLPENFEKDKGRQIWGNAKSSMISAATIYYTLIPYLLRMNDFCPNTAVFCKPPAEDDVMIDEVGNIRPVPYHDVPECMVTEFIQQDKLLYGEVSALLKEYPDLTARLHGEFRYGMHENRTAKVMPESGINMLWGLMTMFRPAGAEHRMKVETILNKMHEEFNNKQRPHDVIDKYRKYLNEAMELGIKLKWLTTGQRIVMKVNAMDPMFATVLSKYIDEDTELDDAALKLDRLFTEIAKISQRIDKKDNENHMKENHPKRLFHVSDFEPYPYICRRSGILPQEGGLWG